MDNWKSKRLSEPCNEQERKGELSFLVTVSTHQPAMLVFFGNFQGYNHPSKELDELFVPIEERTDDGSKPANHSC